MPVSGRHGPAVPTPPARERRCLRPKGTRTARSSRWSWCSTCCSPCSTTPNPKKDSRGRASSKGDGRRRVGVGAEVGGRHPDVADAPPTRGRPCRPRSCAPRGGGANAHRRAKARFRELTPRARHGSCAPDAPQRTRPRSPLLQGAPLFFLSSKRHVKRRVPRRPKLRPRDLGLAEPLIGTGVRCTGSREEIGSRA
jgi:hypothetical protein